MTTNIWHESSESPLDGAGMACPQKNRVLGLLGAAAGALVHSGRGRASTRIREGGAGRALRRPRACREASVHFHGKGMHILFLKSPPPFGPRESMCTEVVPSPSSRDLRAPGSVASRCCVCHAA